MRKHAYLIIAHNEFEVLQKLIHILDDIRNDIYVLIDKKVAIMPQLGCVHSRLYILNNRERVAVYWGHVSQIKAEYALFQAAFKKEIYAYYHIISGTHLPLKSQDFIHAFYKQHEGRQIMQPMENDTYQTNMKIKSRHFFIQYFKHPNKQVQRIAQILWRRSLKLQSLLKLSSNKPGNYIKAANWVSLTHDCVAYLIQQESSIIKKYSGTFCGDEFFVPSELAASPFKKSCFFYPYLVYSNIKKDTSQTIQSEECTKLLQTDYLFARKFEQKNMAAVEMVIKHVKQNP